MRLASSGPFHNLITFVWLWLLAFSSASDMFWTDIGDQGRVVQFVSVVRPRLWIDSYG